MCHPPYNRFKSFVPEKVLIKVIHTFLLLRPGDRGHFKACRGTHLDVAAARFPNLLLDLIIRIDHDVDPFHAKGVQLFKSTLVLSVAWNAGKTHEAAGIRDPRAKLYARSDFIMPSVRHTASSPS